MEELYIGRSRKGIQMRLYEISSPKQISYDSFMNRLKREYIQNEGSLQGMCYDFCLEMQKEFPELHWIEGKVRTKNGWESHSWMMDDNGKEYDPTVEQFDVVPVDKLIRKIDGKRVTKNTKVPKQFTSWSGSYWEN